MPPLRSEAASYIPLTERQQQVNANEMNNLLREIDTRRRSNLNLRAEAAPYVPLHVRQQQNNRKEMNSLLREINTRRRRNLNPGANQNEMTNLLREINNMRAHNLQQHGGRTRKQKRRSLKKSNKSKRTRRS